MTDTLTQRVAEVFHDEYEAAAIKHGWKTQESCRTKFSDLPEANKLTMIDATQAAIEASGAQHLQGLVGV
ncbi:hypothetical protein, partial [Streptococcus pneumoniae]